MPWNESDDLQDVYAGPEDFMEAGARGFLITCVPDKEELAVDQAMKMLRKACVKLYGGMKPVKSSTALFSCGYIAVDFMDPESVTVVPNPHVKAESAESQQEKENETEKDEEDDIMEEGDTGKETDQVEKTADDNDTDNAQAAEKEETNDGEDETEEDTPKKVNLETQEGETQEQDEEMEADKTDGNTGDQDTSASKEASNEDEGKKKNEASDGADKEKEGKTKEGEKSQKSKSNKDQDRKKRDQKRKRKHDDATPKWPLMKSAHKFKAFRTELRNILFIKSDVPEPFLLVSEVMELIIKRKPLKGYAIYQLLPIQGVCNYSYWEVEVMCRRVLAPFFREDLEKPPSFGVLMFDKLTDPGAEILSEIVRTTVWSLNPLAWQNHPICEPDVTIHLELIGSKIVLSAMPRFMKYRQFSPFCLTELGEGKPDIRENQDDYEGSPSKDKSDSSKTESKGKNRNQGGRPHKNEESSSGKGKDKGSHDKSNDDERDPKKNEKDKENTEDGESEKQETEEDEGGIEKEEIEEPTKKEEKKTPQKRGGRRAASQKKKK